MKKIIFIILFLLLLCHNNLVYGESTNEILQEQEETLGISSFIKESKKYTQESFEDIDLDSFYRSALTGKIDKNGILKGILKIAGKETIYIIRTLGYILVIIIIHSIVKNISEGLENNQIGQITYYVQYILIVTLVMGNFSEVILLIKETINNLVGFLNSLLPILIALMVSTGNLVTASTVEPILLIAITFIGNIISSVFLPLILVGTLLGIISKISDKIQINKLSKFFKSSVVWTLGILLTIFVRNFITRRKLNK